MDPFTRDRSACVKQDPRGWNYSQVEQPPWVRGGQGLVHADLGYTCTIYDSNI